MANFEAFFFTTCSIEKIQKHALQDAIFWTVEHVHKWQINRIYQQINIIPAVFLFFVQHF